MDLDRQVQASPDSLRLNLLAAEAWEKMSGGQEWKWSSLYPHWIRLSRVGNKFKGERSSDGVNWTTMQEQEIVMSSRLYWGVGISGLAKEKPTSALLEVVEIRNDKGEVVPLHEWKSIDLGEMDMKGGIQKAEGNQWRVQCGSGDIWGKKDQSFFAYQAFEGDGQWTIKVNQIDETGEWTKAYLMARETLEADSVNAAVVMGARMGPAFQFRLVANNDSKVSPLTFFSTPFEYQAEYRGGKLQFSFSTDSKNWYPVKSIDLEGESWYVGVEIYSGSDKVAEAAFDSIQIEGKVVPIPVGSELTAWSADPKWVTATNSTGENKGRVEKQENEFRLFSPEKNKNRYRGIYQKVEGNFKVRARLLEVKPGGGRVLLAVRKSPEKGPSAVMGYLIRDKRFIVTQVEGGTEKSLAYYEKAAEIAPEVQQLGNKIASELLKQNAFGSACSLYLKMMKKDFINAFERGSSEVLSAFEGANRMRELEAVIDSWKPIPYNPMGGGSDNRRILDFAKNLSEKKQTDLALKLLDKVEQAKEPHLSVEIKTQKIEIYQQTGKSDLIREELIKMVVGEKRNESPLGGVMQFFTQDDELWNLSTSSNRGIKYGKSSLMSLMMSEEILPIQEELLREARKRVGDDVQGIKKIDQVELIVRLLKRDPRYQELLPNLDKIDAMNLMNSDNFYAVVEMAMLSWVEEYPRFLTWINQYKKKVDLNQARDHYLQKILQTRWWMSEGIENKQMHEESVKDLREWTRAGLRSSSSASSWNEAEGGLLLVELLLNEGRVADVTMLWSELKESREVKKSLSQEDFKKWYEGVEKNLKFLRGELSPSQLLVVPIEGGKTDLEPTVLWDLNGGFDPHALSLVSAPIKTSPPPVEVYAGTGLSQMSLAQTIQGKSYRETVSLKLPQGTKVYDLRSKIGEKILRSRPIWLTDGVNLIQNHSLQKNGNTITGWKQNSTGLLCAMLDPWGGKRSFVRLSCFDSSGPAEEMLLHDPISIQPKSTYCFRMWKRPYGGRDRILFYWLDSEKKRLSDERYDNQIQTATWSQIQVILGAVSNGSMKEIPEKAKFLQIGIYLDGNMAIGDLRLEKIID